MEVPVAREISLPRALGEFRIHAVLGQGGSGVVYDATWGPRRVALKVLHPALIAEGVASQFFSEAARLQAIQHPAVVKVFSVGELPDGRPFLAMERLDGETLASVLARGPLPLPDALALFEELCGAIGALHAQGLVHRDIKPENVFIVGGKHAVLLDFGIAKELAAPASTTTMDGGVRGTPAYMAPERFFGQPAAVATDVYELAVTLYAMLAGLLPWEDLADPEARLSPRPLEDAAIPRELDVEIRRALSTRAQNRPPHTAAFLEAVRSAAGSPLTVAVAPSETARMAPAADVAGAPPVTSSGERPWFAERKSGGRTVSLGGAKTPGTNTPLAWAPTESAPARVRRRRWPYVAAAIAGALALTALAVWRYRDTGAPAVASAPEATPRSEPDPWAPGTRSAAPVKATDAEVVEVARRELAAAIRHVPADAQVVIGAVISELRGNAQFEQILTKASALARDSGLLDTLPCLRSIVDGADWAIYAGTSMEVDRGATLIVHGGWQRAALEACFAKEAKPLALADGARMFELSDLGWVDFVDDHTLYASLRSDLGAAQVHELARGGTGPTKRAQQLLATLPAERTLTAVFDGTKLTWPDAALPPGSHAAAWFRIEPTQTAFELAIEAPEPKAAAKLVASFQAAVDELFVAKEARLLGRVDVASDGARVRVSGHLTSWTIGLIASQIP